MSLWWWENVGPVGLAEAKRRSREGSGPRVVPWSYVQKMKRLHGPESRLYRLALRAYETNPK